MLAACLACLAVARGIAVDVDLGGQRATLSATANSLERVTSEGVAECGDSRFLMLFHGLSYRWYLPPCPPRLHRPKRLLSEIQKNRPSKRCVAFSFG